MKAKKIAKRLRKLGAKFAAEALNYDGETHAAERARLFTIGDVCQVLADQVFSVPPWKRNKKGSNRDPMVLAKAMDWTNYKGKNFPPDKAVD